MGRPFLFVAGEFAATMPLVFTRDHWQHTMSGRPLEDLGGGMMGRGGWTRLKWLAGLADVIDAARRRLRCSKL